MRVKLLPVILRLPLVRAVVKARDALARHYAGVDREREELAEHCARLEKQLAESLDRERALQRERDERARESAARERALACALRELRSRDETGAPDNPILSNMRLDWDARARSEPSYFIATGDEARTDDGFFTSGEENVRNEILTDMQNICQGRDPKQMRVIEIGCGVGRLTRALAAIFGEVHAVDVSPAMIALAREKIGHLPNVHLYVNNGADLSVLPGLAFHFAFSFLVFQHIPSKSIIESYIRDVARLLVPGALFKFQVEGAPRVEDRPHDDTWHGVSLTEEEMREMADRCGFEMRYAHGAGTQYYWLWFFRGAAV
jgi:SAM-dependent methyltransferase